MTTADALSGAIRNIPDFPKPGIQFKDITPILAHPVLVRQAVEALAEPFLDAGIQKVLGIEARGFLFGVLLAERLGAGFVPIRKPGKLPWQTVSEEYALEYGSDRVEMHVDALQPGERVLVHDDVIATGGTAAATVRLARRVGTEVVGCSFLIELDFLAGRDTLEGGGLIHAVLHV